MSFYGEIFWVIYRVVAARATACGRRARAAALPAPASIPRRRRAGSFYLSLAFLHAVFALAGCADGPGALLVDSSQYSAYHCKDLVNQRKALLARKKQLRALMGKASQGGGGVIIGTLAYRTDYESVLTEEKLVEREAAEKKCQLVPAYASDGTIH
jgi:hypothetical protein